MSITNNQTPLFPRCDPPVVTPQSPGVNFGAMDDRVRVFMEVTNLMDEEEAKSILNACQGNLEEAISTYLSKVDFERMGEAPPRNEGLRNRGPSRYPPGAAANQPTQRSGVCQREEDQMERTNLYQVWNQVGSLLCPIMKNAYSLMSTCLKMVSTYIVNSPQSANFTQYYEERFGRRHANFFQGSLSDAIRVSIQQGKLLLVYLHTENSNGTYFCEFIFKNEEVKSFLDNSCVLFALDITKGDVRELGNVLNVCVLPQMNVIQTCYVKEFEELSIIYGNPSVSNILNTVANCIETMNMKKASQSKEEDKTYTDRLLREEQDREYQEALRQDQLRAEEKRRQEEEKKKKEEEKKKMMSQKKDVKLSRRERARRFPLPIKSNEKATRICVRLPNGMKIQSNFSLNHTVEDVYEWAECAEFLRPDARGIKGGEITVPLRFQLICGHTKDVLQRTRETLGEFDLYPSAVLNMKSLDAPSDGGSSAGMASE